MKKKNRISRFLSALFVLSITELSVSPPTLAQRADSLYVADTGDNSIKLFGAIDTSKGTFLGAFVKSSLGGLHGPRGLVFDGAGNLIVSDQNVGTSTPSDITAYDPAGRLLDRIIPHSNANAPAIARGIILWKDPVSNQNFLFVADFSTETQSSKPVTPGRLLKYTADGTLADVLVPPATVSFGTCDLPDSKTAPGEFHPRGVVTGPDGLLYVSNFPCLVSGLRGQVLQFDPRTDRFVGVFIDSLNDLNRPEGLVFGPDGRLYVTSFRSNADGVFDNDKILVFQGPSGGSPGAFVDQIALYPPTLPQQPRAFAQALLFGPSGKLFVPISGDGPDTGSVRRYDVSTKRYDVFVPPATNGGPLKSPWYLTFGKTNPGTLSYATDQQ